MIVKSHDRSIAAAIVVADHNLKLFLTQCKITSFRGGGHVTQLIPLLGTFLERKTRRKQRIVLGMWFIGGKKQLVQEGQSNIALLCLFGTFLSQKKKFVWKWNIISSSGSECLPLNTPKVITFQVCCIGKHTILVLGTNMKYENLVKINIQIQESILYKNIKL